MSTAKITTTPTPLAMVDKINEIITNYLPVDGKAADALKADVAAALSGVTTTATELNYVDGVTSNIQTQLNGKLSTSGTAAKATADASGNNIANTYATKATAITGLSASGKTITYTKGNGTTGTITTQDTVYSLPTASSSTLGGVKVGSGLSISSGVLSASGSIVASSLGTNGYVKFGNGLILQWGVTSKNSSITAQTQTLPTAFASTHYVTLVSYFGTLQYEASVAVTNKTLTNFTFADHGYNNQTNAKPLFFISIGKQQWGYCDKGQTKSVTFPIAFTNTNYAITVTPEYSSGVEVYSTIITSRSTTAATIYVGGSNQGSNVFKRFIAIGYQQWGVLSASSINQKLTFTYALVMSAVYAILTSMQKSDGDNHNANTQCISYTTSKAEIMAQRELTYVLIIGKQQWGSKTPTSAAVVSFTFPISFSSVYAAVGTSGKAGDADASGSRSHVYGVTTTKCSMYALRESWASYIAIGQ